MSKHAHILGRRPVLLLTILLAGLVIVVLLAQVALAANWQTRILETTTGNIGQYTSIALVPSGDPNIAYPHIAYYNASEAALKYTYQDSNGSWHSDNTVDSGSVGQYASIALDSSDMPRISYYDAINGDLKYAHQDSNGSWHKEFVDSTGSVGLYTSLALDASDTPHISYYDTDTADLKYAYKAGGEWHIETVDGTGSVGEYSSIAVNSSGAGPIIHISYYDETNQNLKYAYKDSDGWHTETIDNTGDIGKHTAITLDRAGKPHVSYYDATNTNLKYAYRNPDGFWQIETVDNSTGDVGSYTSITCDMSGMPHIAYYDKTNGDLRYAYKDATGWHKELADGEKDVGMYASIARDSSNNIYISYYDIYNADLKYAYKNITPPTIGQTNPLNNATDTVVSDNIAVSFSEPIMESSSHTSITLKNSAGTDVTIEVSIQDNVIIINPLSDLISNSSYTVNIPADAITDITGNSFAASYSFTFKTKVAKDDAPPTTSIQILGTQGTNGWYKGSAPSITLGVNENATIYYYWDHNYETSSTAPASFMALEGTHTLTYYAVDSANNACDPKTETINVDTIAPKTTVTVSPGSPDGGGGWYKTVPNITLSASESATFYYKWDNRAATTTAGTVKLLDEEGNHTLYYWAVDQAGNAEASEANAPHKTIKVDSTAPCTKISTNPTSPNGTGDWYINRAPTVTLTVDEPYSLPVTLHYKWDDSEETSVVVDRQLQLTGPEGIHTISYYAIDSTGNKEDTHTKDLYVDALPPATPSISCTCTANISNYTSIEVTGTADTSTTVYVVVWNGDATSTTSVSCNGTFKAKIDLTTFADGHSITVTVYAVDEAGNRSQECTHTIVKDTVLPTTTSTTTPAPADDDNGWFKTIPNVTLTRSEPGTTYYRWDTSANATTTATTASFSAPEGQHTLYYHSIDAIGNSEDITSTPFKVDVTAPTVSVTKPTSDETISGDSAEVLALSTDTLSGLSEALLYVDGSFVDTITGPSPYSFTLDTTRYSNFGHTLKVRAYDNAGNFRDSQVNINISNGGSLSTPTVDTGTASLGFGVDIRFSGINTPGTTTISVTDSAPDLPSGFALAGNFYEITTTVNFTGGDIFITFPYDPGISAAEEATLELLHWEVDKWVVVPSKIDKIAKTITGQVSSLSPFAVVKKPVASTPPPGGSPSSGGGSGYNQAPATPQGLKLVSNKGMIRLSWDANKESDLASYRVYRIIGHGGPDKPGKITPLANVNVTQYNDTSANEGIIYTYYVTAVDRAGNESGQARLEAAIAEVEAEVTFFDVPSNAWYKDYVSKLISHNVLGGYPNGTFRPNKAVSRVEFAKMICLAMGWDLINPAKPSFGDVSTQSWEYRYVETAKAHGAITGYANGTFAPGRSITRAEIASILAKALNLPAGSSTLIDINSSWSKGYINSCVKAGIISGYPNRTFKPNGAATRAEAAKMVAGLF